MSKFSDISPYIISVSIGICAYNEELNIRNLLSNLINQSVPCRFEIREIIVVASGCTDKTEEIVNEYKELDKRVKLISEKERYGKTSAVNLLLKHNNSEIIIMESADTIPAPDAIGKLIQPFKNPNVFGVASHPKCINELNSIADYISILIWEYLHHEYSLKEVKLSGELFAIRANIIEKIPSDIILDDAYIQHYIIRKGGKLVYISDSFVFMKGPDKITEIIRQQIRNIIGYIQLRQYTGIKEKTMNPIIIFSLLIKSIVNFQDKKLFMIIIPAIILWIYVNIRAYQYIKNNNIPIGGKWDMHSSTKKISMKNVKENALVLSN